MNTIKPFKKNEAPEASKLSFEKFQNEDDGLFYFQFLDTKGNPILLSNGYNTLLQRERGLEKVKKYASNLGQIKKEKENGLYLFLIKANNNQTIAKSRAFEDKLDMEKALELVHAAAKGEPLSLELEEKAQVQEPNKPIRFNFDLNIYFQSDGNDGLIGKIEYPLTKERISFENLDLNKIGKFISKFLPNKEGGYINNLISDKEETSKNDGIFLSLSKIENGKPTDASTFDVNSNFEFQIHLTKNAKELGVRFFKVKVYSKSLKSKEKNLINSYNGSLALQENNFKIPLKVKALWPDVYQFLFEIELLDRNQSVLYKFEANSHYIKLIKNNVVRISLNGK